MSTITATDTPAVTFEIVTLASGLFGIDVTTVAGTSAVKDSDNLRRVFSTRGSARKAITRLRRSL